MQGRMCKQNTVKRVVLGENVDELTVKRRQSKFLQSDTFCCLIVVQCHVQAVVSAIVFVQCPATYHLQTVQWDVVHVAGNDQHVAGHLADVPQERHVVASVHQKHQFQIAVDIGAVGVACSVLVVVALGVSQAQRCATTYCSQTTHNHSPNSASTTAR